MRCAVIHTVASVDQRFGGPSQSVPSLCSALRAIGVGASIVTQRAGGWNAPMGICEGLRCTYVPTLHSDRFGLTVPFGFARALSTDIEVTGAGIVHDHGLWLPCNHLSAETASRYRLPLVISPRGTLDEWAFNFHSSWKRIAFAVYQKSDLMRAAMFHATSEAEAAAIQSHGFHQPVAIVPNGIDVPEIRSETSGVITAGTPKNALFLSRIHRKKGLDLLLQAWARVRPEGWRLKVVGNGPTDYVREVSDLARRLGIDAAVEFAGWLRGEQKDRAFRDASLFVLPTHTENFGMAIAEAMAYGLPVITTRGAPWRELVEHRCGWWIERDLDSLCAALRDAVSSGPRSLAEMGQRARALVASRYGWDRVAEQFKEVYRWLAGGGRKPPSVV